MKAFLIFVVESERDFAEKLRAYLNDLPNVQIELFATGEECLNQLENHPRLIVLDYDLHTASKKTTDGLHILEAIKEYNHQIPVIMWSSQTHYAIALETIAKGAMHYVIRDEDSFAEIRDYVKMLLKS